MNGHEPVDPFAASRLRIYVKVGDKNCAPGKEWAALHDGDIISWQRYSYNTLTGKQTSGSPGGVRDRIAFAIIDMPDSQANEDMLRAAVSPVEAWLDAEQTKPDKEQWRARAGNIDLAAIATKAGDATLETRWREHETSVEPVVMEDFEAADIRDATQLTFSATRIDDLNQVTTGTYTVGSDAGDDYALPENAYADIGNLTGDLTFRLARAETLASVAPATITENLNNHTFTVTVADGEWHYANPLRGSLVQIAHNSHGFWYQCEGPGTVAFERVRTQRSVAGAAANNQMLVFSGVDAAFDAYVHQSTFDGNSLQGSGIRTADATPVLYIRSCDIFDTGNEGLTLDAADGNANSVYENLTIHGCSNGLNLGNNAGTFRRVAAYANTVDFVLHGNATGYSNYSDDATAADGNWGTGANNGINGNPATDFDSVADTSPKFLRPIRNGVLANPANTDYLADNTTDLAGRPWARFGEYIGARSRPFEPRVPKGGGWRCNGSRWAIPYLCPFEGMHVDRVHAPLVITHGMLSTTALADLFARAKGDGADVVVTNYAGQELPTEVVDWDAANSEFELWVRYDDIDNQNGDTQADATFLIQYGGHGRTINFRQVWANYNGSGTNWSWVGHFQDNCNDSSPSANHGTAQNAPGYVDADYGRGIDLDGVNQWVSVPHNANLAGGNGTNDNPLSVFANVNYVDFTTARIINKGLTDAMRDYGLATNASDYPSFLITDGGAANRQGRQYGTALTSLQNSWISIAGLYTGVGGGDAGRGIRLMLNAERVDDANADAGAYTAMDGDNDVLAIGRYDTDYANGKIAHVRIIQLDLGNQAVALHQQNEMDPGQFWDAGEQADAPTDQSPTRINVGVAVGIGF